MGYRVGIEPIIFIVHHIFIFVSKAYLMVYGPFVLVEVDVFHLGGRAQEVIVGGGNVAGDQCINSHHHGPVIEHYLYTFGLARIQFVYPFFFCHSAAAAKASLSHDPEGHIHQSFGIAHVAYPVFD